MSHTLCDTYNDVIERHIIATFVHVLVSALLKNYFIDNAMSRVRRKINHNVAIETKESQEASILIANLLHLDKIPHCRRKLTTS